MAKVKTLLTVGGMKKKYFSASNFVWEYDNKSFSAEYASVVDFLKDFYPTTSSDRLLNRITEEFNKPAGSITFKPSGYKANQIFHFSN